MIPFIYFRFDAVVVVSVVCSCRAAKLELKLAPTFVGQSPVLAVLISALSRATAIGAGAFRFPVKQHSKEKMLFMLSARMINDYINRTPKETRLKVGCCEKNT